MKATSQAIGKSGKPSYAPCATLAYAVRWPSGGSRSSAIGRSAKFGRSADEQESEWIREPFQAPIEAVLSADSTVLTSDDNVRSRRRFSPSSRVTFALEPFPHEFRDHPLGEVSFAAIHVREAKDDGLNRVGERWVRIGTARSFGAQLRHAVDGEGHLGVGLVDREILRLPVHLAARGVEENGARLRLPTGLQDVQRSELVRLPASVRVQLPPGDSRDG